MNIGNQTIVLKNEILSGLFDAHEYYNCKFIFEDCKFVNFDFDSSSNAIVLMQGNVFFENVCLNAGMIKIKGEINCSNLDKLVLNADRVEIEPGLQLSSYHGISIYSNNLHLQQLKLSSSMVDIQSTYGVTQLQECKISSERGCKITNTQGGLELKNCKIKNQHAVLDDDGKKINGVIIQCFQESGCLIMDQTKIGTDLLEIYYPTKVYINDTSVIKGQEPGRLSLHGDKNICYHYIEPEFELQKFLKNTMDSKNTLHTSKIKQLLKFVS